MSNDIQKPPTSSNSLTKLLEQSHHISAKVELAIHDANVNGRIKMCEADVIIKQGLLK